MSAQNPKGSTYLAWPPFGGTDARVAYATLWFVESAIAEAELSVGVFEELRTGRALVTGILSGNPRAPFLAKVRHTLSGRSFLEGLDRAQQGLRSLVENTRHGTPDARVRMEALAGLYPHLRSMRNTGQHIDERIRRIGAKGKQMPPGVIVLEAIDGRDFVSCDGEGIARRLPVRAETLGAFVAKAQAVVDALDGDGAPE